MKINLMQLYPEVGTKFGISHLVTRALRNKLHELLADIEIRSFVDRFRDNSFPLGFVISATRKTDNLQVKGPTFFDDPPGVDFVIWIPYRDIPDADARIDYVFDGVARGVAEVLRRYDVPDPGIADAVKRVVQDVHEHPKQFEYIPKHEQSRQLRK